MLSVQPAKDDGGMNPELRRALDVATAAALEAGAILRAELHRPGGPRGGDGHAAADEQAEWAIRTRLLGAFPWRYLGEETGAAGPPGADTVWLVDPNDGTAVYLKARRGSAVSIGAVRSGRPILGVVYAFAYPDDRGDLIAWAEGGAITRNGTPVTTALAERSFGRDSLVLVSAAADAFWRGNLSCVAPARFRAVPSVAYRLALVAAGEGDAAVSSSGPCHWDIAAGHALVVAAGGAMVDDRGRAVAYDADGRVQITRSFGGSPAAVRALIGADWATATSVRALWTPGLARRRTPDAERLARAQGCLLGQLAGDALGQLVEMRSAPEIARAYPCGVRELVDGGTWGTIAGQPTDDSELALALARSLADKERFDPDAVLGAYVAWIRSKPFDVGETIRAALEAAAAAPRPEERRAAVRSHARHHSQANGSLMRVSPLGILGAGRPAEAAAWAREDSALTHPNPVCQEACAAFVAAIATAIGGNTDAQQIHAAALAQVASDVRPGAAEVRAALERAPGARPRDDHERAGWVLVALQHAFHQLLRASSFEAGLVDIIGRGGDTDTNAAIAGALLGAARGREAIPRRWRDAILSCRPAAEAGARHPRPLRFWPVDALELAEAVLVAAE